MTLQHTGHHNSAAENEVLVIGAGPAGLTAAHELQSLGFRPIVIERHAQVGGIARTETYKGYRFDIGGHRFYTKVAAVEALWHKLLAENYEQRPRLSRIYYKQKFFPYPIKLLPTLRLLGIVESIQILLSYLEARLFPTEVEETFEQWISNRFGKRLFNTFFKSYTEKVWGIPTHQIRAEWAAQRIKGLSLRTAVQTALFGNRNVKSLIETFHYPTQGPGMMWEAFQADVEQHGGQVCCQTSVTKLFREGNRITHIQLSSEQATQHSKETYQQKTVEQVISSMPLQQLILSISPAPPSNIQAAAKQLRYRGFLIVGLIVNQSELFPDNWLYIHEPAVKVGRIQNFKNWSAAMVPTQAHTSLGMEYFCDEGDALWLMSDQNLIALAKREIIQLGLANAANIIDGVVIRQPKAYPVYDEAYQTHLAAIRAYLDGIENLQTIGRNGMHRYNNQDHSMLTGLLAARNLAGESHDLWQVNTERSYYEEQTIKKNSNKL